MSARSSTAEPLLLAGDVGGTKTDLAVFSAAAGPRRPLVQRRYESAAYAGLPDMARAFLADAGLEVCGACFDVAGVVIDGRTELTNLRWKLDQDSLAEALGVEAVWLLNDLAATAAAVPHLRPEDLHEIKDGQAAPGGTVAVLAPGTGLGEAFLTWDGSRYRPFPSEGAHAAFAPATEQEVELLRTLLRRFDHVSVERVASGIGIPNLYAFLRDQEGMQESAALAADLARDRDPTRHILDAALARGGADPLARATLTLFLGILGTEASNLALKVLATGGLYLAGGIAGAVEAELRTPAFLDAFLRAGRLTATLEPIPMHLIVGEVAIMGAAGEGLRLLASSQDGHAHGLG